MKTTYFQMVELIIGANVVGNTRNVYFDQQPQLQSNNLPGQIVYIEGIETYMDSALPYSPVTASNPVARAADIQNAVLTIAEGTRELKKQIPLTKLCNVWINAGSFVPYPQPLMQFNDLYGIDWTKCYVTLVNTPPVSVPFSYLFGVYYSYERSLT